MELNINRLMLMVNRHMIMDSKKYLRGIIGGLVFALLITLLGLVDGIVHMDTFASITLAAFGIGGVVLTSKIFNEMSDSNSGYQFISLPASNLEKYLSAWIVSYLLYTILAISAMVIGGWVLTSLSLFDIKVIGRSFQGRDLWELASAYLFANALFLFGAATFKSHALVKTVLSFGAVILGFFLLGLGVFGVMYLLGVAPGDSGVKFHGTGYNIRIESFLEENLALEVLSKVIPFAFFHIVGYFKIKEREL